MIRQAARLALAIALTAFAAARISAADSVGLKLVALETQATREPLGITDAFPRLSWRIAGTERGILQRAYRVLVASRENLVAEGKADVWDSGRVTSADPSVKYAGAALASRTRYYWSVRVWTANGKETAGSQPAWFETAFMRADEWKGQWIAGPERTRIASVAEGEADDAAIREAGDLCRPVRWPTTGFAAPRVKNDQGECREVRPAPMLRRSFLVDKKVAQARVYASGLAYNDLSINGTPTSNVCWIRALPTTAARCSTRRVTSRLSCARVRT